MKNEVKSTANGFTIVELLVVVATIAVLAVMLLPALAKAKMRSTLDVCLNNQKLFAVGSIMFSNDHGDYLVSAGQVDGTSDDLFSWRIEPSNLATYPNVPAGQSATKVYDTYGFQLGGLYPYLQNTDIIHCPADTRYLLNDPAWCSYSMVDNMNGAMIPASGTDYRLHKLSQIKSPSGRMILTEENDPRSQFVNGYTVSENIGTWEPYKPGNGGIIGGGDAPSPTINPKFSTMKNGGQTGWYDGPAAFHSTGATFSLCDGHAEFHKWQDTNTLVFAVSTSPTKFATTPPALSFSLSPHDLFWTYSHIATSVWP